MVRVAGLKRRDDDRARGAVGRRTDARASSCERIGDAPGRSRCRHAEVFHESVRPGLADEGIHIVTGPSCRHRPSATQLSTSSASRSSRSSPRWPSTRRTRSPTSAGCRLNLAVVVRDPEHGGEHFARVKVPDNVDRVRQLKSVERGPAVRFLPLEELIAAFLAELFPGMEVVEQHAFRVTRNEDMEVEEDDDENLLQALERELVRRRFGPPVRLEVEPTT